MQLMVKSPLVSKEWQHFYMALYLSYCFIERLVCVCLALCCRIKELSFQIFKVFKISQNWKKSNQRYLQSLCPSSSYSREMLVLVVQKRRRVTKLREPAAASESNVSSQSQCVFERENTSFAKATFFASSKSTVSDVYIYKKFSIVQHDFMLSMTVIHEMVNIF